MHLILITGVPGVGKTTIIRNLGLELTKHSIKFSGFYTEELRNAHGERCGFDIVTFEGKRATLSRASTIVKNTTAQNRVGKYTVTVPEFESVALPVLDICSANILLLDEIGKMELKSKAFEKRLTQLSCSINKGELFFVATIPMKTTSSIVDNLKNIKHTLFHVTVTNRNQIYQNILETTFRMIDKKL
ncbi:cancer-related nucleoside-triphosphatase-like isoform X3 [Topomyia yanbarensis]|nr:cancer-related nucleoside-triphosphatase-like isoform X3 [Topomyia yanbarensis]